VSRGFIQIRRGLQEHLLDGRISLLELAVFTVILFQVDFKTGIWSGSAPRIVAAAPRGATLRGVQRVISRLAKIGFLKVFHQHGRRGNYKVLIHKYEPQSGALMGRRLNALISGCWWNPVYESCAETDTEDSAEAAPYLKEEKNKDLKAAPLRPSQDTKSSTVPTSDKERQIYPGFQKLAAKTHPFPNKPADPLRGDLYGGIHWKGIEKVFFDARRFSLEEQLAIAVKEATTDLALNRTGKMKAVHSSEVEKLALQKLYVEQKTLSAIPDFRLRASSSRNAVGIAVISAAAELLEETQLEASV
jgi:hypothetical protein